MATPIAHHVLLYTYVDGMLEKRTPFRPGHLENINKYVEAGHLKIAGAWNPVNGGMFIFNSSREIVEEFVKSDPYVLNGLVPNWEIREWSVVVNAFQPKL